MVAKGKLTENKFSGWCKNKGFYRLKIQVNNASVGLSGVMLAHSMPADFLVMTGKKACFVEVKEVSTDDRFGTFRQQSKLTKAANLVINGNKVWHGYLLINFVAYNIVAFIEINDYNALLAASNMKTLKLKDFPKANLFTWKTLSIDNIN